MKALKLSSLFVAGLVSSLLATADKAYAVTVNMNTKTVNDSLVQNLSCKNLSVDNIYRAIRADAFDANRNMPIQNWAFKSGMATIAGCWALSSTQRMVSYMARYNATGARSMQERIPVVLDMVRGARVVEAKTNTVDENRNRLSEVKLPYFSVFAVEEGNLRDSRNNYNGLWNKLMDGYDQNVGGYVVRRHFRDEIEANQANHFFRFGNIGMGMGSGKRSERKNAETVEQIIRNASGKRLTLINLRAGRTLQHIVMVKSFKRLSNNIIDFTVYDSNAPERDWSVFYNGRSGQFYAPDVVDRIGAIETKALGVFVVDEEERGKLESAMLAFYKALCK
ncbi:hypothetical protein [Bdellovibrio reynosensis]|uniref:Uncharacterized protein n=1 Tax=Bdellovibrio reynosensis TaxID=2835041 RepID=A0ABY4CDE4_9BACT|nr:hypothetical protein [Bdellovibrio reynosensis]UOF01681.1 hypothetical protein MNR06_01775 [Bdellovibrio reynosensis]